jgi:hypothetical protein
MDCLFPPILCGSCIKDSHATNPLHRIQKWNGFYFDRATFTELGQIIGLGHRGTLCPNRLPESKGRATTVVHINGIHQVRIEFCHCANAPAEHEQLAKAALFPATIERPETTFTFHVLKEFHNLSLTSKIPAYDFVNALTNMTNNAFPGKVLVSPFSLSFFRSINDNIIRIAIASSFVWSVYGVTSQLFAEVDKHMESMVLSATAAPIRSPCVAPLVPNPVSMCNSLTYRMHLKMKRGFNFLRHCLHQRNMFHTRHKYTLFLSVDGNFRLQRKKKRDDPDDVAINKGNAYFADSADLNEYLAHVSPKDDVRNGLFLFIF